MAFIEDIFKGNLGTGLAVGLGALIIGPVIIPIVRGVVKPMAKTAIKGGISLYGLGKRTISEAGEAVSDLIAEAKSEIESQHAKGGTPDDVTGIPLP